jgi:hypothetical protein
MTHMSVTPSSTSFNDLWILGDSATTHLEGTRSFHAVVRCFYNGYVVFNILPNRYRLVTVIHYAKTTGERQTEGHVYIRSFLTHKEYDNPGNWDKRFRTQ